jgi:hypothetical protein
MRVVVAVFILLFMGACATSSLGIHDTFAITTDKIAHIKKNVTTREDLRSMFGEPEIKVPFPEGATYFYKDINLHSLWVKFNEDWTVTDYEYSQ